MAQGCIKRQKYNCARLKALISTREQANANDKYVCASGALAALGARYSQANAASRGRSECQRHLRRTPHRRHQRQGSRRQVIVVRDGAIEAVGSSDSVAILAGAKIVDLTIHRAARPHRYADSHHQRSDACRRMPATDCRCRMALKGRHVRAADFARRYYDHSRRGCDGPQRRRGADAINDGEILTAHAGFRSGARHHRRTLRFQSACSGIQRSQRRRCRRIVGVRTCVRRNEVRRGRHQVLRHRRRVLQGRYARCAAVHVPGNAGADR